MAEALARRRWWSCPSSAPARLVAPIALLRQPQVRLRAKDAPAGGKTNDEHRPCDGRRRSPTRPSTSNLVTTRIKSWRGPDGLDAPVRAWEAPQPPSLGCGESVGGRAVGGAIPVVATSFPGLILMFLPQQCPPPLHGCTCPQPPKCSWRRHTRAAFEQKTKPSLEQQNAEQKMVLRVEFDHATVALAQPSSGANRASVRCPVANVPPWRVRAITLLFFRSGWACASLG